MKEECKDFVGWWVFFLFVCLFCLVGLGFLFWLGFLRYWIFCSLSWDIFGERKLCVY